MKRVPIQALAALASLALLATACSKSDPQANKARANAPLQIPKSATQGAAPAAEANDALKERLARQEAATKLFDKSRPEPARPEPAKAEVVRTAAAAPAKAAPEPVKAPEPVPAKVEPAKPEPVKAPEPAPVAPPKLDLAAARPAAAAPPTGIPAAKLITRVDPEFPREAISAGAEKGTVKARMTLDGNGNVTRVEVVEANPRRVFDRAVVRALSQWHFSDGPSGRTVETEVEFRLK